MSATPIEARLDAGRAAKRLCLIIAGLLLLHLANRVFVLDFGDSEKRWFVALFDLDGEGTVPSLYAGLSLLLTAGLLAFAGIGERRFARPSAPWTTLSAIFVYLALDEWLGLHEHLVEPMRELFHARGYFNFAWIIPFGALTATLGVLYIPFLLRLPKRTRNLFALAGAIFVGGAIGMEMIGGAFIEAGLPRIYYAAEVVVEESMEMLGIALFIYAIIAHIQREQPGVELRIGFERPAHRKSP